jgi:hypothetical protein
MSEEKQNEEVKTGKEAVCKECKRPYYWGYYYPPPKRESKKYFGLPGWLWAVVILITLLLLFIIIPFIVFFSMIEPTEDTQTYSFDVKIAENGHYKYTLGFYYYEDIDVILDIHLLNGSNFDVYIMNDDQYESVYGSENDSVLAFATIYSMENVNSLSDEITVPSNEWELYLVIDNSANPLSENDAEPEGPIEVQVKIEITTMFYWD